MNNVEKTATKIFEYASSCVEFGMQPSIDVIINYAWCLYYDGAIDKLADKLEVRD